MLNTIYDSLNNFQQQFNIYTRVRQGNIWRRDRLK